MNSIVRLILITGCAIIHSFMPAQFLTKESTSSYTWMAKKPTSKRGYKAARVRPHEQAPIWASARFLEQTHTHTQVVFDPLSIGKK